MPTFRSQPSADLANSIRRAVASRNLAGNEDMINMQGDMAAAQTAQHLGLAEKARAEAEVLRNAEAARGDPKIATEYASRSSGLTDAEGGRLMGHLRGAVEQPSSNDDLDAAMAGNTAQPFPMGPPNVNPGQRRGFESALASTIANRLATGHTNAEQLAKSGQDINKTAVENAATDTTNVPDANRLIAAITGKVREPFKMTAQGALLNEESGALNEDTATGRAHRAHLASEGGKPPAGYAWGPRNAKGQPTLAAIEGGPAGAPVGGGANTGLSGDEFLKTLPPGVASNVKGIVSGDIPMTAFSTKGGHRERILELAGQYEPGFDLTNWKRRNETAAAFSKGMQGNAVRAVNQTIAHMGSLDKASVELNNPGGLLTLTNPIVNLAQERTGDARQGVFRQKAMAVSSELRKVFSSGGVGNLTELQKWEETLPLNASKEQQKKYLLSGIDLLDGAINALDDQYKRGMGPNASVMNLISPKAKQTLEQLKSGASAPAAAAAAGPMNAKGWKLMKDAKGNQAYVSPDGKDFEELK